MREHIIHAKGYDGIEKHVAPWDGERVFKEIVEAIERRAGNRVPVLLDGTADAGALAVSSDENAEATLREDGATTGCLGLAVTPPEEPLVLPPLVASLSAVVA